MAEVLHLSAQHRFRQERRSTGLVDAQRVGDLLNVDHLTAVAGVFDDVPPASGRGYVFIGQWNDRGNADVARMSAVFPFGLDQRPFSIMASTISLQYIGFLAWASTRSAAPIWLSGRSERWGACAGVAPLDFFAVVSW